MKNSIFGTDGIRGLTDKYPLQPAIVEKIGYAAGIVIAQKSRKSGKSGKGGTVAAPIIVIGRDTRGSGGWIEKKLARGFLKAGLRVFSCGVIPTAAIAAILQKKNFLGGAVISASHNPPEFNGIKFFSAVGKKIPDSWEAEIEHQLKALKKLPSRQVFKAIEPFAEGKDIFLQLLRDSLPDGFSLKGLKWVVDCAQGSASQIAPRFLESLGAQVTVLHSSPDGKNINLHSGALHPKALQSAVVKTRAHGGCAFDGDADRVQFVDEKGQLLDGDVLIGMAAQHFKEEKRLKENAVVATVMANLGFIRKIEKLGIRVVSCPVGDRSVLEALESSGAILGGEQSGHIIFRDYLPTGDGLLTALQILKVLVQKKKKLSYYEKVFPKTPQVLLNVRVEQKVPVEQLPRVKKAIHKAEQQLGRNGRVFVRYSGTEPLLRVMVEGPSQKVIARIAEEIAEEAKSVLA